MENVVVSKTTGLNNLVGSTPTTSTIKRVYGPYTNKTGKNKGRVNVIIHYKDGTRKCQSFARFLVEQKLQRILKDDEHVDHINNDHTDNRIENLQVLYYADNIRKSIKPAKYITQNCLWCGRVFTRRLNKEKANRKQGKRGPYCGKSCASRGSHPSNCRDGETENTVGLDPTA